MLRQFGCEGIVVAYFCCMLSVAFDAKRLFNNHTGLGNYSRTLVHNLTRLYPDLSLSLWTPGIDSAFRQYAELADQVHTPPKGTWQAYWRSVGIKHDLKRVKPQIYHGLSHELPIGLSKLDIKQVVTIHDLIFKFYPETFGWFDRQVYSLKWAYSIRQADKIIAISQHTASDLMEHYPFSADKLEVVYQACGKEYYEPLPDITALMQFKTKHRLPSDYLLSVGSLIPRKNVLRTIQALSLLPGDMRPMLVIVGDGKTYKRQVMESISKMGLEKYVFWWPAAQVNISTLRLLYAGARATVFPSLYEGFGLPVAESLLSHTPVITSQVSSLPEAAGPGGLLVDPHNTESISDAMARLVSDDDICRRLAKNGYDYANEKFSPEITTRKLYEVYTELALT